MRLLYSQAGYHTFSDKTALVATSPPASGGHFALVQDGHEVLRANLRPLAAADHGEEYWLADFTRVRTTGWNELQVALANGERASTGSFRISPVTYRGMAKETLLWLNPQRCGTRVQFWHVACHQNDPAPGGWHCGDSWDKRTDEALLAVWACTMLDAHVRDSTIVPGESMPHIVYEAAGGGEWLLKLQGEDGRFACGVQGWGFGVRCEDDAVARELGEPLGLPACAMIGSALCQLSIRVRRWDKELADRCLQSAAEVWRTHRTREPSVASLESQPRSWHSAFALLDLGLCCAIAARKDTFELNLPDTEPAREDLERRIEAVLAEPEQFTWDLMAMPFCRWTTPMALLEFIDKFPEGERCERARVAVNRYFETALGLTAANPFGLVPACEDPRGKAGQWWDAGNGYLLTAAFVLARAADVLGRFDLLAIAERHVQWVWGRNPLGVSMMCGVGEGSQQTGPQIGMRGLGVWFTPNAAYREHADGYQVGGVVSGIKPDENGAPHLDVRTLDDERERLGLDCNRATNAYSLPATASMMMSCCAIDRVLERLRGGA